MGVTAIINIVLDIVLVGPLGMGTAGAVYATVITQRPSFAISLFYLKRHRMFFSVGNHSKFTLQWDKLAAIVRVGLSTTIQTVVVNAAYLLAADIFNQFGTAVSAASDVGLQINAFTAMSCWAIGQAVMAMAGQCMGAGQVGCVRKVIRTSLVMNVTVALAIVIDVQLFTEPLILLFGSTSETVNNSVYYLCICRSISSLIYAATCTLDSFTIGVGAVNVAMINALLDTAIVRLPMSWPLTFALYMGFPGIYYGQATSPMLPATVGLFYFASKRREHKTLTQTDHKGRSL